MSDASCTPRAVMEAAASAALARYLQAVGDGTRRIEAERAYRDHVLKAADRYALTSIDERVRQQIAAAVSASRDADQAPTRRAELDNELSAMRRLRATAGAR